MAWSRSRLVFFGLTLLLFYFAIRQFSELSQIKALLLTMNPAWLLLALGAQIMTYACNAWIITVLLKGKTGAAGFFALFKISVVIMFVNQLLPTGGISGNGYVFNELVKRKIKAPRAFKALILETLCYYAALLLLLGVCYAWYNEQVPRIKPQISYTVLTGFVFFGLLAALLLITSQQRTLAWLTHKLSRFVWLKRHLRKLHLTSLHDDQPMLAGNEKPAFYGVLLQTGILLLDTVTVYALIRGLGTDMPYGLMTLGFLLTLVIGSLPTSPGSLIAYEGAMTYFFHLFGLPVQTALVLTLLFRFFTFWLPLPVGLLLYRNLRKAV